VRDVAQARPQVLLCLCTNFPAAVLAAPLEAELGLPVYDSTALGVWHALALLGADTRAAAPAWGSLFTQTL
jgi:maleate isomerase